MCILLLGKEGQVGKHLQETLATVGQVIALSRKELDLEDLYEVERQLNHYKPTVIVNAAAYTAVDNAENNQDLAFLINADVVHVLANYAKHHHALLLHYSTDYVFDGLKSSPYHETDPTHPQTVYGLSKRAGELAILESHCNFIIFRTSWVFSTHGHNFIKTILNLAKEQENLNVVSDQHGTPTSAAFIAQITALAIDAYQKKQMNDGIYHLTALGITTWHALACYVTHQATALGMTLKLSQEKIHPVSSDNYPRPAQRPLNSSLDTSKLKEALSLRIKPWQSYVDETLLHLAHQQHEVML
ncbi:MAG: dTDP-4-dehydrorhamnose reductase [Legionellaceae bacterium]